MVSKLVPPKLEPVNDSALSAEVPVERPDLRTTTRRPRPMVDSLIAQGFVTEAAVPERIGKLVPPNAQASGRMNPGATLVPYELSVCIL